MSKVYFFRGSEYIRYDVKNDAADPQYPLSIARYWSGLPPTGVDAAINWGNGKTYFFRGSEYYRFDNKTDRVDPNYPKPIRGNWPGLSLDRVDACINWGNGKANFFRGSQYWRYDIAEDKVDPHYPKSIASEWERLFSENIEAAINWGNGKAYFFRGKLYSRYDVENDSVDPHYPKPISQYWRGLFPDGVRAPVMLGFAGIDRLEYPDAFIQQLWADTNLTWTGFYLAPAPSQGYTGWMARLNFLRNMGWGIAPLYLGQQEVGGPGSHILTAVQGSLDAVNAIALSAAAGITPGSVLYLDIETGGPIQPGLADYYRNWVQGVLDGGYHPGLYCSYRLAPQFLALDNRPTFWVFNINKFPNGQAARYQNPYPAPEPLLSTVPFAAAWQLSQNSRLVTPTDQLIYPIDFDSCSMRDPLVIT